MHAQIQAERRERRAAIWQRGKEAAAEARLRQGLRGQLLELQRGSLSMARACMAVKLQQLYGNSWGSTWLAQQDDRACHLARVLADCGLIAADGAADVIAHAAHVIAHDAH